MFAQKKVTLPKGLAHYLFVALHLPSSTPSRLLLGRHKLIILDEADRFALFPAKRMHSHRFFLFVVV
jgi:hypothetical protein